MSVVISVRNWDRYQHYKDRDPPWVKLYRDLLTSESWVLGTDTTRVVQIAITLLAARYSNQIPYRFDLIKKVTSLDCSEASFKKAIEHLGGANFLEIQELTEPEKQLEQLASKTLAKCSSETEQSRAEQRQNGHGSVVPTDIAAVFDHWKQTHSHPKAQLDEKRIKLIRVALKVYTPEQLCESISGYKRSAWHQGKNDRKRVFDDIGLFLRDAEHIDAGIKLAEGGVIEWM